MALPPEQGQWDVDNDGDGVPDSVWVDLGMPVRSTPDGRLYKPLFAILCVDLDGRINLNTAGSLAEVDPGYTSGGTGTTATGDVFAGGAVTTAGGSITLPANYPRGLGFGPAEISPAPLSRRLERYSSAIGRQHRRRHEPMKAAMATTSMPGIGLAQADHVEQMVRVWAELPDHVFGRELARKLLATSQREQCRLVRFAARSVWHRGRGPGSGGPAVLCGHEGRPQRPPYFGFGSSIVSLPTN